MAAAGAGGGGGAGRAVGAAAGAGTAVVADDEVLGAGEVGGGFVAVVSGFPAPLVSSTADWRPGSLSQATSVRHVHIAKATQRMSAG